MALLLNAFGWTTAGNAVLPRGDKHFHARLRDADWQNRLKVRGEALALLPDQQPVVKNERHTDFVFDRLLHGHTLNVWRRLSIFLLYIWFWLLVIVLIVGPDLAFSEHFLGEAIYNERSIPTKSFTGIQVLPMAPKPYIDFSMLMQFARERLIGPFIAAVGFFPPAFYEPWRFLYTSSKLYVALVATFGIILQVIAQFFERFLHYLTKRRLAKNPIANAQHIATVVGEANRLVTELKAYSAWQKSLTTRKELSPTLALRLSIMKREICWKIEYLYSSVPAEHRPIVTDEDRKKKLPYLPVNALFLYGNAFFYIFAWGSFSQALAYATVMTINTWFYVNEWHQSPDDMKNFTTNTVASLVGQFFFVSIPYRASKKKSAETKVGFIIVLTVQETYVLVFSSKAVPVMKTGMGKLIDKFSRENVEHDDEGVIAL